MTVYIVTAESYDTSTVRIVGVFSSADKAEPHINKMSLNWHYDVEPWEVDGSIVD